MGLSEWVVFSLESCLHSVLGAAVDVVSSYSSVWECLSFVEESEVETLWSLIQ